MDYTERILYYMTLFLQGVQRSKDKAAPFKAKAYENAIKSVANYDKPITTVEDVKNLQGIGAKIRKKMIEIVETNYLTEAEGLEEVEAVRNDLLQMHGIGPVKADELIKEYGIRSIEQLQEMALKMPDFFTNAQLLALAYYSDLKERIPRFEMMKHEHYLKEFFLQRVPEFSITIVGSYRRGLAFSGDIDILLSYNGITHKRASELFEWCLEELQTTEYMIGTLSSGKFKFLGICKLTNHDSYNSNFSNSLKTIARRIDILLTPPEEIACSLLYFTGSKNFNISFRNIAISEGYTLNEHRLAKKENKYIVKGLPSIYGDIPDVPEFKNEKDVFDFLHIKYQVPEERVGPIERF